MIARARPLALFLTAYNNLLNLTSPRLAPFVGLNLATASALFVAARRAGHSWEELGLSPRLTASVAGRSVVTAAAAAVAVAVAAAAPPTRPLFRDARAADLEPREVALWALVRIPLGTVVLEEVAFRGALDAAARRERGHPDAALLSAAAFAAWHIVPTYRAVRANAQHAPIRHTAAVVAAGVAATGLAGLALSALRHRTGTLLAPAALHAAVNATAAVTAAIVTNKPR